MSSAKKHKARSRRSYKNRAAMLDTFQRVQITNLQAKKAMEERGRFAAKVMGLFKKGDK